MLNRNRFRWLTLFAEGDGDGGGGGGGGTPTWFDSIPEDIRGDDALKPFAGKPIDGLIKDYLGTKRMLGSRIPIPGQDAAPEVMTEFRNKLANIPGIALMPAEGDADAQSAFWGKLGRPATAAEYGLAKPDKLPPGVEWSDDQIKAFTEQAHALGLTKAQVVGLNDWNLQQQTLAAETAIEAGKQAESALRTKWGAAYDQNLGIGRQALEKLGGPEMATKYGDLLKGNPEFAVLMHAAGLATLEDKVIRSVGGDGNLVSTPAEIQDKIDELKAHPAYTDNKNPEHARVVAKMSAYYDQLTKARRMAG